MQEDIGNGYCIRSWQESDAQAISEYGSNRKIWLNMRDSFRHPYTPKYAMEFIRAALAKSPETLLAIASDQEAIGSIGMCVGSDVHRYTAELGYWLAEPYWGQGIMTSAISAFTEYCFNEFELKRIHSEPYASNAASSRVLEKAGYTYEGRLSASVYKDGRVMDQLVYAKLGVT